MKMKSMARSGAEGNTRLLSKYGGGSSGPRQHYANGGAVKAKAFGGEVDDDMAAEGDMAAPRLDRPSRKPKGEAKTTVNVIIAGKDDKANALPPLGGPSDMPPPMPPAPMPPGGPGGMPMMRKHGGRVVSKAQKKADGGGVSKHYRDMASEKATDGALAAAQGVGVALMNRIPGGGKIAKGIGHGLTATNAGLAYKNFKDAGKYRDAADKWEKTGLPDRPEERKNGGAVKMKDGAGGGLGRLEKVKKYGE